MSNDRTEETQPSVILDDAYFAAQDAAFKTSPIYIRGRVTFRVSGIAPATSPGDIVYADNGAEATGYSLPYVRGTVIEDARDLNPHTGELEGPLMVRVDQTVTWRGEPSWRQPRDFVKGSIVRILAKDVEPDELQAIGREWSDAQIAAANIIAPVRERLRTAIVAARATGLSESEIACRVRTTRQTVRDIQGKPRSGRGRPVGTAKAIQLLTEASDEWRELAARAPWVNQLATAAAGDEAVVTKLGITLRRSADGTWA
jgi:hypothetical protein